jgi:hypothetical protein
VEKSVKHYGNFAEAERADREFYRKLSGNERLQLLLELINNPKGRIDRSLVQIRKLNNPNAD